jgi:hypothetical protein
MVYQIPIVPYKAYVGGPSLDRQKEVNRKYNEDKATHRRCKTIRMFLLKLINS